MQTRIVLNKHICLLLLFAMVSVLSACGQKGSLFLSGHAPAVYADQSVDDQQAASGDGQAKEESDRQIPDLSEP